MLPLLRASVEANRVDKDEVSVEALAWGDESAVERLSPPFDCVLLADLVYELDLLPLLGVDDAPLMTKESNNYLENLQNKVIADGILLPLSLIGASQVAPFTRRLADGKAAFGLDDLANIELEPYVPRQITQPLLPPGSSVDQQFDSAIDRTTAAQAQVQAVQQ